MRRLTQILTASPKGTDMVKAIQNPSLTFLDKIK